MQKLTSAQLDKRLQEFPNWVKEEDKLISGFEFEDFKQAISFVNAVARVAEVLQHHPDIYIFDYKYVQVLTSTHDLKGFTEQDFKLMAKIDELVESKEESQHKV